MIAVSACLAGCVCTYNQKSHPCQEIIELVKTGQAITVCPEVLGGLPIPRTPCEIIDGKAIDCHGIDRSDEYLLGAKKALEIIKEHHIDTVIVKSKSPSCGKGLIYDGTFNHRLIPGDGIFVKLLQENGIMVYNDNEFDKVIIEKR